MTTFTEALVTILGLVTTVALASVILSKRSNTAAVIQAGASGFGNILGVAESPVTGAQYHINLSYPGSDFSGSFGIAGF